MSRKLRDMTPSERETYRQLAGNVTSTIIPDDASFVLIVWDRETGKTQVMTDAPPGVADLILENLLKQRKNRN